MVKDGTPIDHSTEHFKNLAERDVEITNSDLYDFVEYIIETLEPGEDDAGINGHLDDISPDLHLNLYREPKSDDKPYDTMNIEVEHIRSSEFIEFRKSANGEVTTWWNIPEVYSYLLQDDVIEDEYTQIRLSSGQRRIMFNSLHTLHAQNLAKINQTNT